MTMREYIVTIHKDGHITACEYEEPQGCVYRDIEAVERDAYNQALRDVQIILQAERENCVQKMFFRRHDQDWVTRWTVRSAVCTLLDTAIESLVRKS